jgi:hypothetical protein
MTRKRWIGYAALAVFLAMVPASAQARPITLAWNANPEPTVAGYVIGYGIQSGIYTTLVDVGNVTTFTLDLPGTQYYLAVRAYNTSGASSVFSAEVADSSLIVLANPGDQNNRAGASVSLRLVATGSPVSYLATNLPGGLSLNTATGWITGIVSAGAATSSPYFVSAKVSDASGNTTSVQFMWTITPDGAPWVTSPANQSNLEKATISLQVAASDPDGDVLTYSATGLPPTLTINPVTGLISGTLSSTSAGTYTVTVTASDGSLSNSKTFTWTVMDVNTKADVTVYRPSTGGWFTLQSSTNYTTSSSVSWGLSTDRIVPGDYDGDGKADPAVYRPSTGAWHILKSSTNFTTSMSLSWGLSTDVPEPGDYDGDGKTDPAVYRPSTGSWYILYSSTNYTTSGAVSWGLNTDIPLPADYDGDGKTDPAIYRPSTGLWAILKSSTGYSSGIYVSWGLSTDVPVPGDYDGDGKVDPAIFRPSTGLWAILKSSTGFGSSIDISWGLSTDVPVPGDYDGDGKTDPAIFRPSTGLWAILKSSTGYSSAISVSWGLSTDVPVNKRPQP